MSSCTVPVTRSPGHLYLIYVHTSQALVHTVSVRFTAGTLISDIPNHRATALEWADNLKPCLTAVFTITGWGIKDASGNHYYSEAFITPVVGIRSGAVGMQDACSSTVTITGKGDPASAGNCTGPVRHVFHTGAGYLFASKFKYTQTSANAELDDLSSWLFSRSDIWADFYGQKANTNQLYPVQYNARVQKKWGT